jgi:hypothetical protein
MKINLLKGFAAVAMLCMIGAVLAGPIQTVKLVGSTYIVYSDCQSMRQGGISGLIGAVCLGGDIAFGGIVGGSMAYAAYACVGVGLIGLPCAIVAGTAAAIV